MCSVKLLLEKNSKLPPQSVVRKNKLKGETTGHSKAMGSLRMFGVRGLLLSIFFALGTNGQLLTDKIPLGKVFGFMEIFLKQ